MSQLKRKVEFNARIKQVFMWPLGFNVIIFIMVLVAFIEQHEHVYLYVFFLIMAFFLSGLMMVYIHKRLTLEVLNFALHAGLKHQESMKTFLIPYAILDKSGRVKWFNDAFYLAASMDDQGEWTEKTLLNKNINGILPGLNNLQFGDGGLVEKVVAHHDRTLRLVMKSFHVEEDEAHTIHKHTIEEENLYSFYMFDITKETQLARMNHDQKAVVALLYIDNFDEVLDSIEDVRRPLLIALIERHIGKFARQVEGVYKKFEKDKFLLVFQQKHLEQLKVEKFTILDQIREINIGNEMAVTLSIGIGIDTQSYDLEYDFARVAMDLALGRGGDQAVVKEQDKLTFYGGKTKTVEKSTRVKARIKAHAFRELIDECDRVIVMGHKMQDMDSLGAAIGVYACARYLNKPANIIINNITTSVKSLYDQMIENEEYPQDLFVTGDAAMHYVTDQTLLVIVDVNRPSYLEYPAITNHVNTVVVFDHHRTSAEYIENATLSYIETYASSTCEMITEIIRYISDKIKLSSLEADALFAGISVDTKNFMVKAGVKTFEAAAFLKRSGADVVRVRKLFKNDMASYKAKATAVRDAEIYRENMAITVCPSDITNPNLVGAQAADELLNISGIKASFVMTQTGDEVYISARSLDEMNVQLLMEKMGGGGHLSVAGAQIQNRSLEDVKTWLKQTIDEFLEEGE